MNSLIKTRPLMPAPTSIKNESNQYLLELLKWSMLTYDEDGIPISQLEQINVRRHQFKQMIPFLTKIDESLNSLLFDYPLLSTQLLDQLSESVSTYSVENRYKSIEDSFQSVRAKLRKKHSLFIRDLTEVIQQMKLALGLDDLQTEIHGFFWDDVQGKIADYSAHFNATKFSQLIRLVHRKIRAVASLKPVLELPDKDFLEQATSLRTRANNQLETLLPIPNQVLNQYTEVDFESIKDIWMSVLELIQQKLRRGNVGLNSSDRIQKLMIDIALKKINKTWKKLPYKTVLIDNTDFDDSLLNSLEEEADEIGQFEELTQSRSVSSKIGFDLIGNKKQEKAILYLGYIIPEELVTESEIQAARLAFSLSAHEPFSQWVIIRVLGLQIDTSALSKRIRGDNKEVGQSHGYFKKWCIYSHRALTYLDQDLAKGHQKLLVDFYETKSFLALCQQEEAPLGNETWYSSLFLPMKKWITGFRSIQTARP